MLSRSKVLFGLGTALVSAAILAGGANTTSAQGNLSLTPFAVDAPGEIQLFTEADGKRVDFRVIVGRRGGGVDVVRSTRRTDFGIEIGLECAGGENQSGNLEGNSPLSSRDDLFLRCPLGSRPVRIIGAVGILDR